MVARSRYYSQAQIEAWHSVLPGADILAYRYTDGRTALVAVDFTDRPLAFGDVEQNGHIQYFYCAPEAIGRGIGRLLFSKLAAAAAHQKPERMFVEASESALGFFKRCGFEVIGRRDLRIGSVAIHNYEMARNLAVACA
jgi:putative acetyltransferase